MYSELPCVGSIRLFFFVDKSVYTYYNEEKTKGVIV